MERPMGMTEAVAFLLFNRIYSSSTAPYQSLQEVLAISCGVVPCPGRSMPETE